MYSMQSNEKAFTFVYKKIQDKSLLLYNKNYNLPFTPNNHNLKYISIVTFCQKVCVEIFNSHESSIFLIHVNKLNFCCAISLPHE